MNEKEKIIFEYFKTKHFNYIPVLSNIIENPQKTAEKKINELKNLNSKNHIKKKMES